MVIEVRRTKGTQGFVCAIGIVALLFLVAATSVSAQCSDPSKHFRSGVWKQWVYWTLPGPSASAAVQRIITEMNQARAAAGQPLIVFDPQEPLILGIYEENNPRGPDGSNLIDRRPNQEVFFATFAELDGALNGEVVVFLTDNLRSNAELTAKLTAAGVPGRAAVFGRTMKFDLAGSDSAVSAKWVVSNESDRVRFSAQYLSSAITVRSRFPGAATYLNCNLGHSIDVVFRSLPTETLAFLERNQSAYLLDLARKDVEVDLKVRHHDPDIDAMFNDPANRPYLLIELDRVVRFERH